MEKYRATIVPQVAMDYDGPSGPRLLWYFCAISPLKTWPAFNACLWTAVDICKLHTPCSSWSVHDSIFLTNPFKSSWSKNTYISLYIYIYRYKNNDKNPEKHESDYWTYNNNLQNITKYHTMTIKWHNKNRIYKWAKWSTNIYKSTLYE